MFYISSRNLWKVAISRCEIFFYFILFYSFDTSMISKQLSNDFYCFFVVFNFLFFCKVSWFNSARGFCDICVVATEISYEFFFCNYYWFFSANIISAFSRNPLLVTNSSINFQKFLLVWAPVFVTLLKYTLITFRIRDTHLFFCFLYIALFSSVGFLFFYCLYSLICL